MVVQAVVRFVLYVTLILKDFLTVHLDCLKAAITKSIKDLTRMDVL